MTWPLTVALAAAVLVGAITQRSTGMGFALVASPFLLLLLGPFQGILVTNVCGTAAALLNLTQVYRDVDWRRARWVVPAGVIGVIPGALAVRALPTGPLSIAVSVTVLLGLAFTAFSRRLKLPNKPPVAVVGGLASGFMNVTAGVGGPGLAVYALATHWKHAGFAATAQLHFAVLGVASLAAKGALPSLSWPTWLVVVAALGLGLLIGNRLAKRINGAAALRWVIVIATIGAVAALVQGIWTL